QRAAILIFEDIYPWNFRQAAHEGRAESFGQAGRLYLLAQRRVKSRSREVHFNMLYKLPHCRRVVLRPVAGCNLKAAALNQILELMAAGIRIKGPGQPDRT